LSKIKKNGQKWKKQIFPSLRSNLALKWLKVATELFTCKASTKFKHNCVIFLKFIFLPSLFFFTFEDFFFNKINYHYHSWEMYEWITILAITLYLWYLWQFKSGIKDKKQINEIYVLLFFTNFHTFQRRWNGYWTSE